MIAVPLLAGVFPGPKGIAAGGGHAVTGANIGYVAAVRQAFQHRSYVLLVAGFFVCGFQLAFITTHLPPYLTEAGISPTLAAWALALIGLFNVFGSYLAGALGQKFAKRKILAAIYLGRSVAIALFLRAPLSPLSVYLFSAVIGLLWLSTVPPTTGLIAGLFGPRYIGMLFGVVFFSHQIGSFLGAWLGGIVYDATLSYDIMWMSTVAAGVFATLVHLPIRDASVRAAA